MIPLGYKFFFEEISDERLMFINESPFCSRSSIEECDYIIHNVFLWDDPHTNRILKSLSEKYKSFNKFVIVFILHDFEGSYIYCSNLILLRTSLESSRKWKNEIVLPFIWNPPSTLYPPLYAPSLPTVGFCGQVTPSRRNILTTFSKSKDVISNFIFRDHFWGNGPRTQSSVEDFNINMRDNVFNIAQRGSGNYAMRFYQILASGRIPVLVNTDMDLPFADVVKWNDYIVFEKTEDDCLARVIEICKTDQYIFMQEACGKLFSQYFSRQVLFQHLIAQINRTICKPSFSSSTFRYFTESRLNIPLYIYRSLPGRLWLMFKK